MIGKTNATPPRETPDDYAVAKIISRTLKTINYDGNTIGDYAFYSNSTIEKIILTEATSVGAYSFCYAHLKTIVASKLTEIKQAAFTSSGLQSITLGANQVCSLNSTSSIPATSSHHIIVYVPNDLIEDYKVATN